MIKSAIKKGDFVKCEHPARSGQIYLVVDFDDFIYLVHTDRVADGLETLTLSDFWKCSGKFFAANFSLVENTPTPAPTTTKYYFCGRDCYGQRNGIVFPTELQDKYVKHESGLNWLRVDMVHESGYIEPAETCILYTTEESATRAALA